MSMLEGLQSFLETSPMAVVTANSDGMIISASAACRAIMGREPKELIGQSLTALIDDKDFEEMFGSDIQSLLKIVTELKKIPDITVNSKDGTEKIVDIVFNEWQSDGETFYTAMYHDLTDRIEVEKVKHQFISTVSHELRTPLTSIHGALGLIGSGAMGKIPAEAQELLDIAYNNCERLTRLINDILDVEKIEGSDFVFDMEELDIDKLIERSVKANISYADKSDVSLTYESSAKGVSCRVDKDRILQVMDNLISNACKFSPEGGAVAVKTEQDGDKVLVKVVDNGPGIPFEFQDVIFDRFTQSDSSDTKKRSGTGLGLNISKMIAEGHSGDITFETDIGIGTTFCLRLNAHKQAETTVAPIVKPVAHVLICEDDEDIARLIQLTLAQRGIRADIALNAASAKAKLASGRYGVLTLDLMLPDQYGLDLLADVRKEPFGKDLEVIVVSAVADRVDADAQSLSIGHVMSKPINTGELLDVVGEALEAITLSETPKILHLEDDIDIRKIVESTLGEDIDLIGVGTIAEARQQLKNNSFDLILLDMSLPDGSAEELMSFIAQSQPKAKVLIFSAFNTSKKINQQVTGALVKAKVSIQELADQVHQLIMADKE